MLTFVKTGAGDGAIHYTACDGERVVGTCRLTLDGRTVRLAYDIVDCERFVLASCVHAASAFGLRVAADFDERLTMYGFTADGPDMAANPQDIQFPSECGGHL